jgi:hypothetical protein
MFGAWASLSPSQFVAQHFSCISEATLVCVVKLSGFMVVQQSKHSQTFSSHENYLVLMTK